MALGWWTGEMGGLMAGSPLGGRLMSFATRCVRRWLVRRCAGVWRSSLRTISRPTRLRGPCSCAACSPNSPVSCIWSIRLPMTQMPIASSGSGASLAASSRIIIIAKTLSRYLLMPKHTLRCSLRLLMTCFVTSAVLLLLTTVLLDYKHLPLDQPGSI